MSRASKRCNCRDEQGKLLGKACPELAKRAHGAWWGRYEAPPGADGVRRRPWVGPFATETRANEELNKLRVKVTAGAPVSDRTLTFRKFLRKHYLPSIKDLKPSTQQSYREVIDLYGDPGLGHLKMSQLHEDRFAELFEAMALINRPLGGGESKEVDELLKRLITVRATAEWRPGKGLHSSRPLSPSRIHLAFRVLRAAVGYAFQTRRLEYDLRKHIKAPRAVRPRPIVWTAERVERWKKTGHVPGPVMVWTPAQCGCFFDHCEDKHERLFALFHLVATRGLRRGDARTLEWSDVDLDGEGTASIMQPLDPSAGPKSEAGVRTVKLGAGNVALLKAWRIRQRKERLRAGAAWVETGLVFTRRNGEALREEFLSQRFEILVRRCGLPPIRFHDLRHGAATYGLAAGVDMKVISATLGHSRHSFTADTYASVLPDLAEEAAEATVALIPRRTRKTTSS